MRERTRYEICSDSTVEDIYHHFMKASSDNVLDIMYEGVIKQIEQLQLNEPKKDELALKAWRALGRRQEDFDGIGKNSRQATAKQLEKSSAMTPEGKLGELLRTLT